MAAKKAKELTHPDGRKDDGHRVWIRAMGESLGFPRLPLGGAESLAGGEHAWLTFLASPLVGDDLIDRAVKTLLRLAEER